VATLEAKAVAGLAYMGTQTADAQVLTAATHHESRIVRAEAIRTFLFNKNFSAVAVRQLRELVATNEQIFIDRMYRIPGETADTFNARLDAYLKAHPEVTPPDPIKSGEPLQVTPMDATTEPAF
jgi:hypothetical protein